MIGVTDTIQQRQRYRRCCLSRVQVKSPIEWQRWDPKALRWSYMPTSEQNGEGGSSRHLETLVLRGLSPQGESGPVGDRTGHLRFCSKRSSSSLASIGMSNSGYPLHLRIRSLNVPKIWELSLDGCRLGCRAEKFISSSCTK